MCAFSMEVSFPCPLFAAFLWHNSVCAFPIFLTLSSCPLFQENEQGIFDAILRGRIDFASDPWPSISSSAKDLVKNMLRADPKKRLMAVEVLSKFNFLIVADWFFILRVSKVVVGSKDQLSIFFTK